MVRLVTPSSLPHMARIADATMPISRRLDVVSHTPGEPRQTCRAACRIRQIRRRLPHAWDRLALLACCFVTLSVGLVARLTTPPSAMLSVSEARSVLGVAAGASTEELKKAMRRKIREVHPDVIKDDGSKLNMVREAFAVLDPEQAPPRWSLDPTTWPGAAGVKTPSGRAGSWGSPAAQQKLRMEEEERRKRNLRAKSDWERLQEQQIASQVFQPRAGSHGNRDVPTATLDWYKAVTNIRIRAGPDIGSPAVGKVVRQGETVVVNGELVKNGVKYLQLRDKRGWIFNKGISGEWKDRWIVQRL